MTAQTELQCVSCETTFEPTPNGGFCPDCDTPHPDYAQSSADEDDDGATDATDTGGVSDEQTEDEVGDGGAETSADAEVEADVELGGDASPSVCPDCGAVLDQEAADEAATDDSTGDADLSACPDCGRSVTDEAFCPDCGADLDEVRDSLEPSDETDHAETASEDEAAEAAEVEANADAADAAEADDADTGTADATPESVTLVIDGESYTFGDGDTFGRQDEAWLEDLVNVAGGPDDVAYISSEHLEFSIEDDGVYVRDVGRNGTALNGTDLDGGEAQIEDGDTLELSERAEIEVSL